MLYLFYELDAVHETETYYKQRQESSALGMLLIKTT